MKIAVIGGGPAGLYAATLIKKREPSWPIIVLEQNTPNDTFGFGVVLADSGLNRLRGADAEIHDRLIDRMSFASEQAIVHGETAILVKRGTKGGAITRLEMLEVLQNAARDAGVELRFGVRIESLDQLAAQGLTDADVVIGADGINSVVRTTFAEGFGTTRSTLTNHFAWYGVAKALKPGALVFRRHGVGAFVAHYYTYSATRSTFVGECDDAAWRGLGMAQMSEAARIALLESIYAPELGGARLITNNSTWRQFPVIRNREWAVGRHVLLGDAHTSAHFSIGSGTRIAMEDSITLAASLTETDGSVSDRFAHFAATRGPQKAKLIGASERSCLWYERIGEWLDRYNPHEFVHAFMTRTGRVDDARLAVEFPELMVELKRGMRGPHSA